MACLLLPLSLWWCQRALCTQVRPSRATVWLAGPSPAHSAPHPTQLPSSSSSVTMESYWLELLHRYFQSANSHLRGAAIYDLGNEYNFGLECWPQEHVSPPPYFTACEKDCLLTKFGDHSSNCWRLNLLTDSLTDRRMNRQTHRQTDAQTDRRTDRQTHRQTDAQTDRRTDRQTHRQTDAQTDRRTDRQTHRQT